MTDLVRRFLEAMPAHDWATIRDCVTTDVVRIGPYGDTYEGRDGYVAFLAGVLPALPGYRMEIDEVTTVGPLAYARLAETVEVDGEAVRTPELLRFELVNGQIARVEVYLQTLPRS